MKRIKLVVAYDGTNYCGWQVQPGKTTIESVLNDQLKRLLKEDVKVIGASRTDSGVHAFGNVAVFDTETRIPGEKISYALNQKLPEDIRIQESSEVESDFHPRRCRCQKTYEYKILNCRFPNPVCRLYTHFFYQPLNVEQMKKGAEFLVGRHDFKSFCSAGSQVEDTVREIYDLVIQKDGDIVTLQIRGSGFLYNMVRIIAGTLIQVGIGKYEPERIKDIIEAKDRSFAGPTAPAKGLTLVKIDYFP
jgi:tRNA pseudouridine38-40 synthase